MSATAFIVGVHHFCDHRCWRCPLTARCRVHDRWGRIREPASIRTEPAARVAMVVKTALEVTVDEIAEMAALHGIPLDSVPCDASSAAATGEGAADAATESPLGVAAREYAELSWHALRALRGLLAARRDPDGLDACHRLEEMCFSVASKIYRSLSGVGGADPHPGDPQSGPNGSAKVALLLIEESRQAWRVLMRPGRARGGGAPARFVAMLDGLETGLLRWFPRAFEFVRPGFDTGGLDGPDGEVARALLVPDARGNASRN